MANQPADSVELDSRVERRFGKWNHESVENVLYAAVGMVRCLKRSSESKRC